MTTKEKWRGPKYTTTTGSRYQAGRDVKDIAAEIRKAIKAAVKAGYLPPIKASVRISRYSMGQSIDVEITEAPQIINVAAWLENEASHWNKSWVDLGGRYTDEGQHILATIEAIGKQYHQEQKSDQPDDYCNVSFFLDVKFSSDLTHRQFDAAKAT